MAKKIKEKKTYNKKKEEKSRFFIIKSICKLKFFFVDFFKYSFINICNKIYSIIKFAITLFKGTYLLCSIILSFIFFLVESIFTWCWHGIKKIWSFFKNCVIWLSRWIKKLVYRYFILFLISFLLSHKLLFNDLYYLNIHHLHYALIALVIIAIFLGNRGAIQTFWICIGFLVSMLCYGMEDIGYYYLSTISDNIFKKYTIETIIVLLICFIPIITNFFEKINSEKPYKMMRKDLYSDRLDLYYTISKYLSNHNILAINSPYGNGKTTMIEVLKNENKKWNFITIGILSTTVENVEFCIVREINRILESNGIFLNPVNKIKTFFSHDFVYCIGDLLFENQSYEDQIKSFVYGVQCLKKIIVLNFEDIDRIVNKDHLNKIFSICDTLTKYELKYKKQYIKIIYQCNINSLNNLYEKEYGERYVEKFIPQSYSISILIGDIFKNVMKKNEQRFWKIKKINFNFLNRKLEQNLLQKELSLSFVNHTVRGIERILDKINSFFENEKKVSVYNEPAAETIVIYYIIQYFFPYICELLKRGKKMDEQKLFFSPESKYGNISLIELRNEVTSSFPDQGSKINKYFDVDTNIKKKDNNDALLFLSLLGYDDEYYGCCEYINNHQYNNGINQTQMKKFKIVVRKMRQRENILQQLLKLHS